MLSFILSFVRLAQSTTHVIQVRDRATRLRAAPIALDAGKRRTRVVID